MKILVGISGGVDSAYAAKMLRDEGNEIVGCILKMHEFSDISGAEHVASELGIPLVCLDCTERFDSEIKSYFVEEYMRGRTPNPCIICNERVKFKVLYDYAVPNGFDKIATGHYAKIDFDSDEGKYYLSCAKDRSKDQTYMLYRLPDNILSMLLLPLGNSIKSDVRKSSKESGLSSADAKDSQEICFLPDGCYAEYIESKVGKIPEGNFIDEEGNILGKHKGIIRYTVGQRKGLGISLGKRMFVTNIDPQLGTVTLGEELKGKRTVAISMIAPVGLSEKRLASKSLKAKLRYTAPLVDVKVELKEGGKVILYTETEVKAAPGQSAVIYENDRVILGGIIDN